MWMTTDMWMVVVRYSAYFATNRKKKTSKVELRKCITDVLMKGDLNACD